MQLYVAAPQYSKNEKTQHVSATSSTSSKAALNDIQSIPFGEKRKMNDFKDAKTAKEKVATEEYDDEEVFEQELEEEEDGVDEVSKKKKKKKVR